MATKRRPLRAARLLVFPLPSVPTSRESAFDSTAAAIAAAVDEETLVTGTDVYVAVLRAAIAEVWQLSGIPEGMIPEDDVLRALVCTSDEPAHAVACVRRFSGLDPRGRDAFGLRFFLELGGERAWAVLHFHEVGTPGPAEPVFPKARMGPVPPGLAWIGLPPDPGVAPTYLFPN